MSFSHEVRGSLAKCLSQENIIVEHKKVDTAMFDVDKRILTLPLWDNASDQVYQMLVLHEVSHAIWTDNIDWTVEYSDVPKAFINVLEDARVEKLCKKKYPGSSKHFFNGYNELNDQDFFSVKDKNLNNLSFIDRINLYFKIGAFHNITFNDDENEFVTRISKLETFQEVLDLARDIFIFVNERKQQSLKIPPINKNSTNNNNKEQFEEESEAENNETFSKEEFNNNFNNEESDGGDLNTDQTFSDDKSGNEPSNQNNHDNELTSETSKSFEDKSKSLTNMCGVETHYVEIPKMNDQMIIPNEYIHNKIKEFYLESSWYTEYYNAVCKNYISYKKSAEKEVSYLVKEFECKKSADQYGRSNIAKTGIIDTQKLHTYKFNEDLFKKVSVIPDGKSHGLIFILDWSSSMSLSILDAYKQLLNLIWFCRKVNIPFEVYAFTSNCKAYLELQPDHPQTYEKVEGVLAPEPSFRLMNYFTSKTNSRVLDEQLKNIWSICYSIQFKRALVPSFIETSGSPIGESIISLHYLIPEYQKKYKVQKVNVVFLTDGEGYQNSLTCRCKTYGDSYIGTKRITPFSIRDKKTGRIYPSINSDYFPEYAKVLLQTVKDKFPTVNLINFRITSSRDFLNCCRWYGNLHESHESMENRISGYENLKSLFNKNGCVQFKETGFDQFNVIASSSLAQDEEFSVPDNATKAQIKSSFVKMLSKKKTNKKLLGSFISLVS